MSTQRSETISGKWSLIKKDEKCFLTHLKSFFCHDFFGYLEKRLKVFSKFIKSSTRKKIITIKYCLISQEVKVIRQQNLAS